MTLNELEANFNLALSYVDMNKHCKNFNYLKNPEKDFSRNRCFSFKKILEMITYLGKHSSKKELFEWKENSPEISKNLPAFIQMREKIMPKALYDLLKIFNSLNKTTFKNLLTLCKGFRLVAIDGSDVFLPKDKKDDKTYISPKDREGYCLEHFNCLLDLSNHIISDCILQGKKEVNEVAAAKEMICNDDRSNPTIYLLDRLYLSFDLMATIADDCNSFYVIRAKNNLAELKDIKNLEKEYDDVIPIMITTTNTKESRVKCSNFKYVHHLIGYKKNKELKKHQSWFHDDLYEMKIRVVHYKVSDGNFQTVVTNLPKEQFSTEEVKELYHDRWEIETAFKEMKHYLGRFSLNSKRRELIEQQILGRLILFNKVSIATELAEREKEADEKKSGIKRMLKYKVSFSMTAFILISRLRNKKSLDDVISEAKLYLVAIRGGRSFVRNKRGAPDSSGIYGF